jgi:hypothetical protein
MDVVVVVVVTALVTGVVLVVGGWSAGRPRLPGIRSDRLDGGGGDPWHDDPRREVVDRPAGADAEAMAPDPGADADSSGGGSRS